MNRASLALILLALGSGAAAEHRAHGEDKPASNFEVPRADLMSTVKTIGIMPIVVAEEVPDKDTVAARYEAEIAARLTSAGFAVVPASAMREVRERNQAALGGLYDPMTGQRIKEKVDALNEFSSHEYLATHQVDALLQPAIALRSAPFNVGKASWDGVVDSSSGPDRTGFSHFMATLAAGGVDVEGRLPALSFVVRLTDAGGKLLYSGAGGLQLLSYSRVTVVKMLSTTRQLPVDPKFIMTDPARDARALSIALDPLVGGSTAPAPAHIAGAPAMQADAAGAQRSMSLEEVAARFPRVALAPLALGEMAQHEAVTLRYREALMQKLRQLGFEVVGGDEYGPLWEAERTAAGGYFDPVTGRPDEAKLKASRQRVFGLMLQHLDATAVIVPSVISRCARFDGGVAEWDGVRESLTPGESKLRAVFDSNLEYGGHLDGISLQVNIIDPLGEVVLEGTGGIQLVERLSAGKPTPLAQSELFADPTQDARAADIAFTTLAAPAKEAAAGCAWQTTAVLKHL
ncbi:MAG TPA: hypothetical protein VKB41_00415 [Steroidobacteraceae bacterium]|nr:hypothetical protein [Steroidobacteraceae bacterium]